MSFLSEAALDSEKAISYHHGGQWQILVFEEIESTPATAELNMDSK